MSKVKRAYRLIKKAYNLLKTELGILTSKKASLQIAMKRLNNIAKPDKLVHTLLVFRAYPKTTSELLLLTTTIKKAAVIKKATKALRTKVYKQQIRDILGIRN